MRSKGADFTIFKKEFKKWQVRFGLTGYSIDFKCESLGDHSADIEVFQGDMFAVARLDSEVCNDPDSNIPLLAKHEAIHLLIARFQARALARFTTKNEIDEAVEEVTVKLEGLIQ